MLVFSRKSGERVQIGDEIVLTIRRVRGDRVEVSIEAPSRVKIHRKELRGSVIGDMSPKVESSIFERRSTGAQGVESRRNSGEMEKQHEPGVS